MKNEVPTFVVTQDAKELAKCILAGNATAADALIDWILENRNHRGYSVIQYVYLLEDTLRDAWNSIFKARTELAPPYGGGAVLTENAVDTIYRNLWRCIREANTLGREGPG